MPFQHIRQQIFNVGKTLNSLICFHDYSCLWRFFERLKYSISAQTSPVPAESVPARTIQQALVTGPVFSQRLAVSGLCLVEHVQEDGDTEAGKQMNERDQHRDRRTLEGHDGSLPLAVKPLSA